MSGTIFGGDEVGAIVFDLGSYSLRAGFAGADSPTVDLSSHIGLIPSEKRTLVGSIQPGHYKKGMQVAPLLQGGLVENWDYFESAIDTIYKSLNIFESSECPAIFSETAWNTREKREKMAEIMFEKFKVPAFFVMKNSVLSCFANGRSTGLVFDCGASQMSAVPVYEGMVLQQGVIRSPFGGDFIAQQCEKMLVEELKVNLVPGYAVKWKNTVKIGEPPVYSEKEDLTEVHPSFRKFGIKQLMQDFTASLLQVCDESYTESMASTLPTMTYEFPDGYRLDVGHERFRIPETLFDSSLLREISQGNSMTAPHVIVNSINLCDIDTRANLYSNVIVTGGNTLIQGFTDRLQKELNNKTPSNMRLKLLYNLNSSAERRFSSWIGGSILGSLGTFQQMWISQHEYNEGGKSIISKKCL